MAVIGNITFGGTLTGLTGSGNNLNFLFTSVFPTTPTAGDTALDSAFGPKGLVQLTLIGAPAGYSLGGSFGPISYQ